MRVNVVKTYKGCIELRDYNVKDCINKNESIEVHYNGDKMTLSPNQLKDEIVMTSKLMKSKMGKKDYRLVGYYWNPDSIEL